jgi:hypothetical protein
VNGTGRRELFVLQFQVPMRDCIDEKLGFAEIGTGVDSIVCATPAHGTAISRLTQNRNKRSNYEHAGILSR